MLNQTKVRSLWMALCVSLCGVHSTSAFPIITSVVQSGGDNNAQNPAQFTGQTFDHPNLGANFTVPRFGEEVPAYRDRVHEYTAANPDLKLPRYLVGGEYIMIRNDNRNNGSFQLLVTLSQAATVYILVDNRLADGVSADPPTFGPTSMQWLLDAGFQPVMTGLNRNADPTSPDEVGIDEGADRPGPGQGVNQWFSVYALDFPAGTFTLLQADNANRNMYGVVVKATTPGPQVIGTSGDLLGFGFEVEDGTQFGVNTNNLALTLDDAPVAVTSVTSADGVTSITYRPPTPFASGSIHTARLVFSDTANPSTKYTNSFTFTADVYPTLTSAHAVARDVVDTSSSGFYARVAQFRDSARWPGNNLPNNTQRAEDQLAGRLIDPITANPMQNFALPGPGSAGSYTVELINMSQDASIGNLAEAGNFQSTSTPPQQDGAIPGIPGTDPDSPVNTDNIAAEFIGYLDLTPGLYQFGVNSDDGFRVTAGQDPRAPGAIELGAYVGGRGAADSLFYVAVAEAGIYPVRLIWYEGGGGASVEFFSRNVETGEIRLINDRANGGLTSYSKLSLPRPSVSVFPLAGDTEVSGAARIQAQIFENGSGIANGSLRLTVNGKVVTPDEIRRSGDITTVIYDPPGLLPAAFTNEVTLVFTDTGNPPSTAEHTWSFVTHDWETFPVIPPSFSVGANNVDLLSSGFNADVYQMPVARSGFPDNNSSQAAEHQLARRYIDPSTGEPYINLAYPGFNPDGTYPVEVINWNQQAPANAGGFNAGVGFDDIEIPGIPAGDQNHIVAEAIGYVELKAGLYTFGVNSDDGFKVTTAPNPRDQAPLQLGIFNTGRGAANTLFSFRVEEDGIYPMRLLWWEGTGGASVEFFVQHQESGARTLINDRTRLFTVKSYNTYTGPILPAVQSATPLPGATGVAPDTAIEFVVSALGNATTQVLLNGQEVNATKSTSENLTTFSFKPDSLFPSGSTNEVQLLIDGKPRTWTFVVQNYPTLDADLALPADAADENSRGLRALIFQANKGAAGNRTLENSVARAESQIAGTLIDPETNQPYANEAIPGPESGAYIVSTVNWNEDSGGLGAERGNFQAPEIPDEPIPGIDPIAVGHNDNIAAEILAWIDLPAGLVKLGVNSDDGFRLAIGHERGASAGTQVGVFNAGRGAADSLLHLFAPVAGLYPVRLVWFEGGGDASLEFYSVTEAGQRVRINDTAAGGFKAFYRVNQQPPKPSLTIQRNGGNLTVEWTGGGTLQSTTSLTPPVQWSDGGTGGTHTEAITGEAKYFRVRR